MTTRAKKAFLFIGILVGIFSGCLGVETQPENHLGWALLFSGTAFVAIGAIMLGILFFKDSIEPERPDRSLWLPFTGMIIIALITPLEYLCLPPVLTRSDLIQDIGLILFAGGLCFYVLLIESGRPKSPTNSPTSTEPTRLPTGFSQWIVRPIFPALLLTTLGLSIGFSSLFGLGMVFLLILPGLINRMKIEDRYFWSVRR